MVSVLCAMLMLCVAQSVQAYDAQTDAKLSGTVISRSNSSTAPHAFDGDAITYFKGSSSDMQWVGLDLGAPHVITRIAFRPRSNSQGADRMLLSLFEGANQPDFMDAVPLYLISQTPARDEMTAVDITVSRGFRYVRYVGSAGSNAEVAELEFYGHQGAGDDSRFYQITDLPTVSIHVQDDAVPQTKGLDFDSRVTITYEGGTLIQEYPVLTRVRGNFSATHENKPYRIKFNDGKSHHMLKGSPRDESPAKCKKWVLINNYGDKTLMRNNIAYEVSRRVGMPFTPWCRCVDLVLNGDYRGTYQLTDYVGLDKNRINIAEMIESDTDPESITGGYLIEMNGYASGDPVYFNSNQGNPISIKDPDDDVIQTAQFNYIRDYFNEMESRVFSADYTDPQKGYRSMLDLETFLKYFLSNEFSGNTDMIWQVFMYKDRGDSLIYTGPVWDNDLALENDGGVYPGNEREDWTYTIRDAGNWMNFVSRVLSDPYAMGRLREIWALLRDDEVFTSENIVAYVDSLRTLVNASQRLNHLRWPYLLQQVHCNPTVWGSWDEEVNNVCRYVGGRVGWMDNKLSYGTLPKEDGKYLISSAYDLYVFSQMVQKGERDADARLTADIDMSEYAGRFRSIGSATSPYTGTFDGDGHIIDGISISGARYVGLFGSVSSGAAISNLRLGPACTFSGSDYVAALVGQVRSGSLTITSCGSEATVVATGSYAASMLGHMRSNAQVTVQDCYHMGSVQAQTGAAAMVGYCAGTLDINGSYSGGTVQGSTEGKEFVCNLGSLTPQHCFSVSSTQVETTTAQDIADGHLCYTLNQRTGRETWRQNIDNKQKRDAHPVPVSRHGKVYLSEGRYTNYNPTQSGFRYYLLEIIAVQSGNTIQLSEFDLLTADMQELEDISMYKYTGGSFNNEEQTNLVDDNVYTKYCGPFNETVYLYFDAGDDVIPHGYRLYTANDTQKSPNRNPVSWRMWGSEVQLDSPDEEAWTLLDEQEQNHTLEAVNYTPFDFYLDFVSAVEYIRLQEEAGGKQTTFGIFDLSGKKVNREQVGKNGARIYIINGKKILK